MRKFSVEMSLILNGEYYPDSDNIVHINLENGISEVNDTLTIKTIESDINLKQGTYYFKIFAAFISNAKLSDDNGNFFNFIVTDFLTDEKFIGFVDEIEKRSIFKTGVNVQPDDKLITLVTCSHEFDSARLVVVGRLLRENEEPTVNVNDASINTVPKYPQAWYDAKDMANPYKNDICWTP